jgi:hypothetical protein
MRLSQIFGSSPSDRANDAAGITIDAMTGIVAGLAFVLAILILAASLKHPAATPIPAQLEQGVDHG